jgi:hypothetical protein
MLKYLLNLIKRLGVYLTKFANKNLYNQSNISVVIKSIRLERDDRCLIFIIENPQIRNVFTTIQELFYVLSNNEKFKNFSQSKALILSAVVFGREMNLHHNIIYKPGLTWDEYFQQIKSDIEKHITNGYPLNEAVVFIMRVWDVDSVTNNVKKKVNPNFRSSKVDKLKSRFYHTNLFHNWPKAAGTSKVMATFGAPVSPHINRNNRNLDGLNIIKFHDRFNKDIMKSNKFIKPLKFKDSFKNNFITSDIETISIDNGIQVPIVITACIGFNDLYKFVIDRDLLMVNRDEAIENLFNEYFNFLINCDIKTVFIHNLGSFDGYFIYKYLILYSYSKGLKPNDVNSLINDDKEFISINLNTEQGLITFKDSYRIFPVSLNKLCDVFHVPGKISKYKKEYNQLDILYNTKLFHEFLEYALQDSKALFDALVSARSIYRDKYKVDICSILSTSTLSLKIYRQHFLKTYIPILTGVEDGFIRSAYYGGATDIYKAYGKNLYYYDVNSLYPHAMMKPMPHKVSYFIKDMSSIKLEDFFGFCEAKITTPENIIRPLLPLRVNARTIFPVGTWTGTYFSEELKEVVK